MKYYFLLLCFLISGKIASATTQTTANQDKPPRLYVKSYSESDNQSGLDYGTNVYVTGYMNGYYSFDTNIFSEASTFEETFNNWQDGAPGSLTQTTLYQDTNVHGPNGTQDTVATFSWQACSWPNIFATEVLSSTGDWTYDYPYTYHTNTFTTSTYTNQPVPINQEHCDISIISNWTYVVSSGSGYIIGTAKATAKSVAQATLKLQTGGKATSKLRNLFGLTGSAANTLHAITDWQGDLAVITSTTIPSQNITIGSYGNLNTNGVKYLTLPDNADVDVTPYVAGVDDYTFNINPPQKYHCYFNVYVLEADPGGIWPYSNTNDVGHAWYGLTTEAPANAYAYSLSSASYWVLTNHLGATIPGNFGYYPSNGIFSPVVCPGILEVPENHKPSEATVHRMFNIGFDRFTNALQFTSTTYSKPGTYDLVGHNCVQAVRDAASAAGGYSLNVCANVPQYFGMMLGFMYSTNVNSLLILP